MQAPSLVQCREPRLSPRRRCQSPPGPGPDWLAAACLGVPYIRVLTRTSHHPIVLTTGRFLDHQYNYVPSLSLSHGLSVSVPPFPTRWGCQWGRCRRRRVVAARGGSLAAAAATSVISAAAAATAVIPIAGSLPLLLPIWNPDHMARKRMYQYVLVYTDICRYKPTLSMKISVLV